MAGHSQFKNIMHRKGAQDAKKAKIFTKILREITVAAKAGSDPTINPRLRAAINDAKLYNVPKDKVNNAITRATSTNNADNFERVRYEGYGPGGIAFIVEGLTDSRNRTVAEVRTIFNKHGGALGETGSVSFLFDRMGMICYPKELTNIEEMLESALEASAIDCIVEEEGYVIYCKAEELNEVSDYLEKKYGAPLKAEQVWKPHSLTEISGEEAQKILSLLEAFEESDDIQRVIGNFKLVE